MGPCRQPAPARPRAAPEPSHRQRLPPRLAITTCTTLYRQVGPPRSPHPPQHHIYTGWTAHATFTFTFSPHIAQHLHYCYATPCRFCTKRGPPSLLPPPRHSYTHRKEYSRYRSITIPLHQFYSTIVSGIYVEKGASGPAVYQFTPPRTLCHSGDILFTTRERAVQPRCGAPSCCALLRVLLHLRGLVWCARGHLSSCMVAPPPAVSTRFLSYSSPASTSSYSMGLNFLVVWLSRIRIASQHGSFVYCAERHLARDCGTPRAPDACYYTAGLLPRVLPPAFCAVRLLCAALYFSQLCYR